MEKPKVYLAVAGAGKTYSICNSLNGDERNLILSFTHENVFNLIRELNKRFGDVPENTIVTTFDNFLLSCFIWPNYIDIQKDFFRKMPTNQKRLSLLKYPYNSTNWHENSKIDYYHYFVNSNNERFLKLENISEMIMESRLKFNNGKTLFEVGLERLQLFFDCIYIDEFQDYRKSDYDLIVALAITFKNCVFYGDYHQHSVSGQNNNGSPFDRKTTYSSFIKKLIKIGFDVDTTSLSKTRRCSKEVCEFVSSNLGIEIFPDDTIKKTGTVNYIFDSKKLNEIRIKEHSVVLSLTNNQKWNSISFGLSKGDTFESIIVVLPDKYLCLNGSNSLEIVQSIESIIMKNKIYVALTRSSGNVYITNRKTMDGTS